MTAMTCVLLVIALAGALALLSRVLPSTLDICLWVLLGTSLVLIGAVEAQLPTQNIMAWMLFAICLLFAAVYEQRWHDRHVWESSQ